MTSPLERARAAFDRQAWAAACRDFAAAESLDAADQEQFAVAAYMVGDDEGCERAWEAAHRAALESDDTPAAARRAVLLALCLVLRGQMAPAGGWLGRAEALLAEMRSACSASGYVLVPKALAALGGGDVDTARELALQAAELGARFGDADLRALGVLGHGQALIAGGDAEGGVARLDEVMVSVTAGEVGPVVTGIVYCAVIIECLRLFDVARASEWTDALSAWCDAQPDLVPYRGQCLVHRSQLHQAAGRWPDASVAAEAACRHLTHPPHPALGLAHYQDAELHRLVGDVDRAEEAYQLASRHGYHPMPGLALLELARGNLEAAAVTIRRALDEAVERLERPGLLAAATEILCAAGDVDGARTVADELVDIAASSGSPLLAGLARHSAGIVLVAEGDPVAALAELRTAARDWQVLHMPYEAARTAVAIGRACAAVGDRTAARLELASARSTFAELHAAPDLDRVDELARLVEDPRSDETVAGLSRREREVLAHLAAGRSNREIAAELVISHHTVGRHVESIFTKLGVSSRAAATAAAYERGLVQGRAPG